jgi:ABC-type molybdate transport system ATPase subunit
MISTISDKMVRALNPTPEILQLDNFMLSINVASGAKLPYLGYVEVDLKIPIISSF